ncbi:MAG: hypothetical protein ABL879_11500, partial [Devosia sp.]
RTGNDRNEGTHETEEFAADDGHDAPALEHGSPFTWSKGESLDELEKPARVIQIVADYDRRKQRDLANRPVNPLRPASIAGSEDIDDLFGEDEGGGACVVCHK